MNIRRKLSQNKAGNIAAMTMSQMWAASLLEHTHLLPTEPSQFWKVGLVTIIILHVVAEKFEIYMI